MKKGKTSTMREIWLEYDSGEIERFEFVRKMTYKAVPACAHVNIHFDDGDMYMYI